MMSPRPESPRILEGKTVLVTRPKEQSEEFLQILRDQGATTVHFPTIEIAAPESWQECDEAIAALDQYDGLLFTSSNAARYFLGRLAEGSIAGVAERIGKKALYSVGMKTADVVSSFGLHPTILKGASTSRAMAEALVKVGPRLLLFPRGNLTMKEAPRILREHGIQTDEIVVYRTIHPARGNLSDIEMALRAGTIDLLTFFSPSSFTNFVELIPTDILSSATIAVIGTTTAEAVRNAGLAVSIMPARPSLKDMIDAILAYYDGEQGVK